MGIPYAEVIGDPIAHSKSPLIYKFWLKKLDIKGDYRAARCTAAGFPHYLAGRCADPFWKGCSVTAPLKEAACRQVADPAGICARIGAVNAIFRSPLGCGIGANTDVLGIASALSSSGFQQGRACIIGAGGATRAALECLSMREGAEVSLLVRDVVRGKALLSAFGRPGGAAFRIADCRGALTGADLLINASPLGMAGMEGMPSRVLDALHVLGDSAVVFDMVYTPFETALLRRAGDCGRRTIDGFTMLIAQAAPAFELFFGRPAPRQHDAELRELLRS